MISLHDGHLTQSPSGTRLALSAGSIGLRIFLNQAISLSLSEGQSRQLPTPNFTTPDAQGELPGSWHVIPRAAPHRPQLPNQVVERFVSPRQVELRRLDHEERC